MDDPAWQEYKILQDKIDRIADFRFRIKGWMVTIVLAIAFGGYAAGRLPPIAYPGLAFVVLVFYLFEQSQAAWHNAFVTRLLELEKEIAFLEARKAIVASESASLKRRMGPRLGPAIKQERERIRSIKFVGGAIHFVISSSHGLFYFLTILIVAFTWWLSYSLPTISVQAPITYRPPGLRSDTVPAEVDVLFAGEDVEQESGGTQLETQPAQVESQLTQPESQPTQLEPRSTQREPEPRQPETQPPQSERVRVRSGTQRDDGSDAQSISRGEAPPPNETVQERQRDDE